jgi:hypothetical protein
MMAKITYKVRFMKCPWGGGNDAWCLVKETIPELGEPFSEPVAVFNFDSEARLFQAHVLTVDPEANVIGIAPGMQDSFRLSKEISRG